jgi:hypothetical protein
MTTKRNCKERKGQLSPLRARTRTAAASTWRAMTAAWRTVLRRRMDSWRLRACARTTWRTATRRTAAARRTMMRRAWRMNSRRHRTRRMDSRRAMMRRPRSNNRRANHWRTHHRRTIDRRAQMMMPTRHDDRHRQHDRRRARQPLQKIFRHPAGGAGVIDLAPALRAAFDLDRCIARQCGDYRIIGARPLAQIDVGGGDRGRCICSGGKHRREHCSSETESNAMHTHSHTMTFNAPYPNLHPGREKRTTPSRSCHCRA